MSQSNPPEHLCSNNTKSRTYLFTINNFTEEEEEKFKTYDCEYSIYQIEIGKKNQIIHIQGTLHFKNPRSFNKLKKDFPRAHIKAIKWGSDEAVFNYCGKSDTRVRGPYEKGNKPEPGSRTDLNDLKDAIMHGHLTVNQIRQDNPIIYHQYGRTLEALQTDYWNSNERSTMTKGVWLYGKTGTGKSHIARELAENQPIYNHTVKDKGWWDRYEQQPVVIFDDFRGEIEYNEILKLVDKYPHHVSRRGQKPLSFNSNLVIVTSSLHPSDVYRKRFIEDSIDQLYRRFLVICMDPDEETGALKGSEADLTSKIDILSAMNQF